MNFQDFNKFSQQFNQFSPEMKEQMMNMAKAKMKEKFKHYFSIPVLTVAAIFVGIVVGALTACFGDILLKITHLRSEFPMILIPLLALGGAGIAFAYKKWGKGTERGMGMVFAVGQGKENHIPLRLIPMVALSTWITHLLGGSAGREGVAVQIGATFGHNISKRIPAENASHILLVAGMAAGFAGLFQTPMAATAFALEVLIVGHLELSALIPAIAAAFTASHVSNYLGLEKFSVDLNALLSASPKVISATGFLDTSFLLKLTLLGILFGLMGGAFAKSLSLSKKYFSNKLTNPIKRIFVMGIFLSLALLILFQGRYAGLGTNLIDMSFSLSGENSIYAYDWIFKFALTILTLSAGFIGGEVTPLLAIGATAGTFLGGLLGLPLPLAAALGYASVFGSASNTLLAPILIGAEVFGFDTLPAFFFVCGIAFACNGGQSIYAQKKLRLK